MSEGKQSQTRLKCSHCGSENTIPIFYGYPAEESMKPLLAAVDRGEIKLGGCCVEEGMPTDHCKNCKRSFGHLVLLQDGGWMRLGEERIDSS